VNPLQPRTPKNRPPEADDAQPSDELTRQLRFHLRAETAELPAPRGPGAAVARARTRRRNRRNVLASAAAVVALAAGGFVITNGTDQADVSTQAASAVLDQSLGFDWTTTNDGLSYLAGSSVGDTGLYALSTAPGTRMKDFPEGAPRAMYRLSDDGTWVPVVHEGDDPKVGRVSQRGDTLYALSTGTVNSPDGAPRGSISTDGGETWSTVPLETIEPPSDAVSWQVYYSLDVASTADQTMAVVSAAVSLPYEEVFPELNDEEHCGVLSTVTTDEGIDLVRQTHRAKDETVISDAEAEERKRAEAEGTFTTQAPTTTTTPDSEGPATTQAPTSTTTPEPGTTVPPDPAMVGPSGAPGDVEAPAEVIRTVTWESLGLTGPDDLAPQMWAYVADGGTWTEAALPAVPATGWGEAVSIHATSDSFVFSTTAYGDNGSTTSSYRSLDGQTWQPLNRPGEGQLLTVGDSLVIVGGNLGQGGGVMVSVDDGATWRPLDLAGLDPALADLPPDTWVVGSSGPLGIALTLSRPEAKAPLLLFSTDLEHWSLTDLGDLTPEDTWINQVIVGTDRVVAVGIGELKEPGGIQPSATIVGVPRQR
jgi:hypothetical protein